VASDLNSSFPSTVHAEVVKASGLIAAGSRPGSTRLIQDSYVARWGDVTVSGEKLLIPYRHYDAADVPSFNSHSVLAAWMTRAHDGHVRELAVRSLLSHPTKLWHPPYVIQLLGEYVVEICEVISDYVMRVLPLDPVAANAYQSFWVANPQFITLTRSRAASYWAAYHWRSSPWLSYPGRSALDSIERLGRDMAVADDRTAQNQPC
jgi:hypothetical protein